MSLKIIFRERKDTLCLVRAFQQRCTVFDDDCFALFWYINFKQLTELHALFHVWANVESHMCYSSKTFTGSSTTQLLAGSGGIREQYSGGIDFHCALKTKHGFRLGTCWCHSQKNTNVHQRGTILIFQWTFSSLWRARRCACSRHWLQGAHVGEVVIEPVELFCCTDLRVRHVSA